jgi:CRP-like cAMP-binding protein
LIHTGKVVLDAHTGDGERVLIQTLTGGDVLGWSWLFPPYYWHFDARAVEATEAVFFFGTPLRNECEADHELGYELLKRMSEVVINRLHVTRRQLLECNVRRPYRP